jgi:hypothetical protein
MPKIPMIGFVCALSLSLMIFVAPADVSAGTNENVERIVRGAFSDKPDMIIIAKCESGFRQFNSDGSVLRGGAGKHYVGIFQIDENIHRAAGLNMGLDIDTLEGNVGYAYHMYSTSGSRPWNSCLVVPAQQPTTAPPSTTPVPAIPIPTPSSAVYVPAGSLTVNLNLGQSHPQVAILQKVLNGKGFVVAPSGPGSPGNETNYFGGMTQAALRSYQCSVGIACDGNESTTGYGRLGPMTRASLNR